jgi:hypothetical protein
MLFHLALPDFAFVCVIAQIFFSSFACPNESVTILQALCVWYMTVSKLCSVSHHLTCYLSLLCVVLEFLCVLRLDGNTKRKNILLEERLVILWTLTGSWGMNCHGKTTWIISISAEMTCQNPCQRKLQTRFCAKSFVACNRWFYPAS